MLRVELCARDVVKVTTTGIDPPGLRLTHTSGAEMMSSKLGCWA